MIVTGFLLRGLSILIFVLVLRIFLNIMEPTSGLDSINGFLLEHYETQIDEKIMLTLLLGGLTSLILIQFVLGKINLWITLSTRERVLTILINNSMNDHRETHLHVSIDHIPPGYDAIIKSSEILLFYGVLLLCIFYMSPLMGMIILVAVPLVLGLLLIKGRKEVFVTQEFREVRKRYQETNCEQDLEKMISLSNQSFSFPFTDMINSQFSSNMAIVLIMVCFLFFYENFEYHGLAAVILVFSIRYSLVYAAELSRLLSRVLKQRTIVTKIETNPFQ